MAVVLGLRPSKLYAGTAKSGSGSGKGEKTETKNKGQFRFHTLTIDDKAVDFVEFELKLDDSSLSGVAPENINKVKDAIKKWLSTDKGVLVLNAKPAFNQAKDDINKTIWCDCSAVASVSLPAGMVFASATSVTADPARAWKKITVDEYDETKGEAADPKIATGPDDAASTTITKPDEAPEVGLWITATTTPTTAIAEASFNWKSESSFEVGIEVTAGGKVFTVVEASATGSFNVTFQCAPVSVTCDAFYRANTVLETKEDQWERTLDKNGNVIKDWHLVKEGEWALTPAPTP